MDKRLKTTKKEKARKIVKLMIEVYKIGKQGEYDKDGYPYLDINALRKDIENILKENQ